MKLLSVRVFPFLCYLKTDGSSQVVVQHSQEKTKLLNLSVNTVQEIEMTREKLDWEKQYSAELLSKLVLEQEQEVEL